MGVPCPSRDRHKRPNPELHRTRPAEHGSRSSPVVSSDWGVHGRAGELLARLQRAQRMDWYEAAREYYLRSPDDTGVSSLPVEWQRELVALMLVNREVNNGGYLQFVANHGREAYEYASRSLRVIGARRMAEIIDRCQALID